MSKLRFTLLFMALAYVSAIADEKTTVGEVTFECKVTGSSQDGFDLNVTNHSSTAKKCKASCTFTDKDGHTTKAYEYENRVRANSEYNFYGQAGLPGAPLRNPQAAASCEDASN